MQHDINWNRIYLEYSPKLLGICRRYVPDTATAEDLVQDSFLTAIQKQNQLKNANLLYAWLKKIVVNNALQYLRNSHQELFVNTEPQNLPDLSQPMTTTSEDNNLILGYEFTTDELLWSIDQLPPHHRSVFNLYYLENYSHAQIADNLGININTSKSHLLRAKKGIQQHLTAKTEGRKLSPLKKKGIQALVFLGFGNLMWAQAFRSKFRNFTVQPQHIPDFSQAVPDPAFANATVNYSANILKKGFTLVALFSGIILFNNFGTDIFPAHDANTIFSFAAVDDAKTPEKTIETTAALIPDEEVPSEKSIVVENNAAKKTNAEAKTKKKPAIAAVSEPAPPKAEPAVQDTATKKPVIIVKKVVKKVKVYVEK